MSRTLGFVAGVATSSTLLYLFGSKVKSDTVLARSSISQSKDHLVRAVDTNNPKLVNVQEPSELRLRDSVNETIKDLWDEEVVKGAKWVLSLDFENWIRKLF
ncbi:hypothetical protein V1514DRAFT_338929 [Lipomyces japonicus]|uniref:uncharacterized protein n=1 Tax=Lipomyces japonicus TaxID=56871 RepID=UPI0034CE55D9